MAGIESFKFLKTPSFNLCLGSGHQKRFLPIENFILNRLTHTAF